MLPSPTVITLGCRLNAHESETMRARAVAAGLDDVVLVNTCAVTEEAVRQAAQSIRRARRDRPTARIVVTGCAAQIEPDRFAVMPEVDHVIGNREKLDAATFAGLAGRALGRTRVASIMEAPAAADEARATEAPDVFVRRVRAYLPVQSGCDHRCTFCIIPYGRGPSRSIPAGTVVDQVRRLVGNGSQEVVLSGVDMTSYGADLPGAPSLGWLMRQVLKHVPELPRLRLSSIDLIEADRHLLAAVAEESRLMPHLHLSMQAGDDMILKRMKRRHRRMDVIAFCEQVRRLRPEVVFGADLIAGFPTETAAMFETTRETVEACGLTYLHVFPYSPRAGTPAARMPQVDRRDIKARAATLRAMGAAAQAQLLADNIGRTVDVLVEQPGLGRTPQFVEVALTAAVPLGTITRVLITGHDGRRATGELAA